MTLKGREDDLVESSGTRVRSGMIVEFWVDQIECDLRRLRADEGVETNGSKFFYRKGAESIASRDQRSSAAWRRENE